MSTQSKLYVYNSKFHSQDTTCKGLVCLNGLFGRVGWVCSIGLFGHKILYRRNVREQQEKS